MANTFNDIIKAIDRGEFAPVYILHGTEGYFIDKISKALEAKVLTEAEKAFNYSSLYGKDVSKKDIVDHARQFPMMAQRRLVILHEAQAMRNIKELEGYMANPAPSTVLAICHKHKKVDQRQKWIKEAKKHGVVFESKPLYNNQVPGWINQYVRSKGLQIEPVASDILAEYVGADLTTIVNQIEKVSINLGEHKKITKDDIIEQVGISKDFNIFELQSAIASKDAFKAFQIIKYFAENEKSHPLPLITSSLYNFLLRVYQAAYYKKMSDRELQGALGLSSQFLLKDYKLSVQNYPTKKIFDAFQYLKKADEHSKGIGSRNETYASIMEQFMIKLFFD